VGKKNHEIIGSPAKLQDLVGHETVLQQGSGLHDQKLLSTWSLRHLRVSDVDEKHL